MMKLDGLLADLCSGNIFWRSLIHSRMDQRPLWFEATTLSTSILSRRQHSDSSNAWFRHARPALDRLIFIPHAKAVCRMQNASGSSCRSSLLRR